MKSYPRLATIITLACFLVGCAHVLSKDALYEVDPSLEYSQVKANPEVFRGHTLELGGMILDHATDREGTTLEVLSYTLDRWGRPIQADEASGRFLARTGRFLEPALYRGGRFVTLTGTVTGQQSRPLKGTSYDYPVFEIGEIYLWPTYEDYPYQGYPAYYGPYYPYYPYYRYPGFYPYGRHHLYYR